MNFLSHYFLDHQIDDSLFVVGASTPDLLSIFDRKIKFKEREISKRVQDREVTAEQLSFYQGVIRHFQVDKLFHSSDFFHEETQELSHKLRLSFPKNELQRSFFVAHILLELSLDRLLIQQDETLLYKFYQHFERCTPQRIKKLTGWLAGRELLTSYDAFLGKFTRDQHLYRYKDWSYIVYVLKRILRRVGIFEYDYLDSKDFMVFLHTYESDLGLRYQQVLEGFMRKLSPQQDLFADKKEKEA